MHPQSSLCHLPRHTLDVGGIEAQVVAQWGTGYIVAVPAASAQPVINSGCITPVSMPQLSSGCPQQLGISVGSDVPQRRFFSGSDVPAAGFLPQVGSSQCGSSSGSNTHAAAAKAADKRSCGSKRRGGRWADAADMEDDGVVASEGTAPSATDKVSPAPELKLLPARARSHGGASFAFSDTKPSTRTPEAVRRNVDLPQGAKVFVHDSDGVCRPLSANKNGSQAPISTKTEEPMRRRSSSGTVPPIPEEKAGALSVPGAKIFVHGSDGSLHHVAQCSKGTTGFEVDMNDQYNPKQQNPRKLEENNRKQEAPPPPPPPEECSAGILGAWQQHIPRHSSGGSSEESTTAESLPSPSQSGGESGGLTPTPGPSCTSRSDGSGAASASHVGHHGAAPAGRQQAPSASSFFAAKARLSAERPDWMKGKPAVVRSYGSAPLLPPPPPPPLEDEPSQVTSSSRPGAASRDSSTEERKAASAQAGVWARQVSKRTGRGRSKANWCDAEDSPRDCLESMPRTHSAPVTAAPTPELPATPETSASTASASTASASPSPQVPMPTQRRGRKGAAAEQGSSKDDGAHLRRKRKGGFWKRMRTYAGQKVSYVRSCLRSCLKFCTARSKAYAKTLIRHASLLALGTSVVFFLFTVVFYFSRVGTNQSTSNVGMLTHQYAPVSAHSWQATLPVAELRDRRIGTLQKRLDMESARALAALQAAKQTRSAVARGSTRTSRAPRRASREPQDRRQQYDSMTPMEKRERYEAAAQAWRSWAQEWQEMAGADLDKLTDAEYEQYLASLREDVGRANSRSSVSSKAAEANYEQWEQIVRAERERMSSRHGESRSSSYGDSKFSGDRSMAALEDTEGGDGVANQFSSMADQASMDEKLAFLMYLQNNYDVS